MNRIIFLLIIELFIGFNLEFINNSSQNIRKINNQPSSKNSSNFTLKTFTQIPNEIDGCGCYFYLTNEDEIKEKYIFINDFAEIAFVSIDGKLEKFKLIKHSEASGFYSYTNGIYQLTIEIVSKKSDGYETSRLKGIIKLTKGKQMYEKKIIGTCGC
jgi:hypothetical protein